MAAPEGDRVIRVDMTTQSVSIEPFPDDWKLLGGRVLSARILRSECEVRFPIRDELFAIKAIG